MKILITESQYKLITEVHDNPIIQMGLKDGNIMVKYKVWDYDNEKDNIVIDTYENYCDDVEQVAKYHVANYFKSRNLNLGNSRLLKELIRKEPRETDYIEFQRDENGKFYPEAFLGDYEHFCHGDRECENNVLRTASRVLRIIYKSQYPITVYRGIKPNEKFKNHEHPGGYWTTKLRVAQSFGDIVYKGLIHNPEDILLLHTMENRMTWPEEFELSSYKVEVVGKV